MTLDQRARTAVDDVRAGVADVTAPDAGAIARRAHRRRTSRRVGAGAAVVVVVGLVAGAIALDDRSDTTQVAVGDDAGPGWSRIIKADAGLDGASPSAVASDGEDAVLVGSVLYGDWWRSAIWWSEDGRSWQAADIPMMSGSVGAVAVHDGTALAFGTEGDRDEPYRRNVVWRSEDGGRTWRDLQLPADAFGPPAPEMGRPNASQIIFHDGWWVAAGGSSTGYAAIWVSRTGEEWEQVLESDEGGGTTLADLPDGDLLAYWTTVGWATDDPTEWGPHFDVDAPRDLYPNSIASGAELAVGQGFERHPDTALLRSDDEGRSWRLDAEFAEAFPGVDLATAAQFDTTSVLAGFDDEGSPGAWVSIDGAPWREIPEALRRPVGGMLNLVTEVDGQVVLFGTAPELNRFYVYGP